MKVRGRLAVALLGAVVAGLAGLVLRRSLARFEIAEESMELALSPGDYVLATSSAEPRRGAIVIFPHPASSMHGPLIKRIVGLGGERIEIANGQVNVEGRPLAEPWANGPTLGTDSWLVGRDEVFVLGDNRASTSMDSRSFGPVPAATLEWRVVFRYWPPARLGGVADITAGE